MSRVTEKARGFQSVTLTEKHCIVREAAYLAALDVVDAAVFHDFDRYICLICDGIGKTKSVAHKQDCPVAKFKEVCDE